MGFCLKTPGGGCSNIKIYRGPGIDEKMTKKKKRELGPDLPNGSSRELSSDSILRCQPSLKRDLEYLKTLPQSHKTLADMIYISNHITFSSYQ